MMSHVVGFGRCFREREMVTDDLGPVAAEGGVKNEERPCMAWCDVRQTRLSDGGQMSGEHSIILGHLVGVWLTPDWIDRMDFYQKPRAFL